MSVRVGERAERTFHVSDAVLEQFAAACDDRNPLHFDDAFAATKGGLIAWTKTIAYEVARHGVTVNCVCPGFIDTDMLRKVAEPVRERLLARVPLGRFGDADEIARAVLYLVRDGDYVTGSCLNVNGGLYM